MAGRTPACACTLPPVACSLPSGPCSLSILPSFHLSSLWPLRFCVPTQLILFCFPPHGPAIYLIPTPHPAAAAVSTHTLTHKPLAIVPSHPSAAAADASAPRLSRRPPRGVQRRVMRRAKTHTPHHTAQRSSSSERRRQLEGAKGALRACRVFCAARAPLPTPQTPCDTAIYNINPRLLGSLF